MGIDLYAEKGKGKDKIELCFGWSYYFKDDNIKSISNVNFEDEEDNILMTKGMLIEKLKGYVMYSLKNIEDANVIVEEFEQVLDILLDDIERLGSVKIFAELQQSGFKFIEK